jgi:hypothetical protein
MKRTTKINLLKLLPKRLVDTLLSLKLILKGDYLSLRRRLLDHERNTGLMALYLLQQQSTFNHRSSSPKGNINRHELSVYSQNGEDGILFYLFSMLGTADRRFVEFGVGDGRQCNTANLSINFGWTGLLLEADEKKATLARFYYQQSGNGLSESVQVVCTKVTQENINDLLLTHNLSGEVDLRSVDIDGNDYWVWQAIHAIQPRVVVIEYNASFGKTEAVTVAYDPNFDRFAKHPTGYYHGASLAALAKLGEKKGYILAGCDSSGTNAFFVRRDVAAAKINPVSVTDAFFPDVRRSPFLSQEQQFAEASSLPLITV